MGIKYGMIQECPTAEGSRNCEVFSWLLYQFLDSEPEVSQFIRLVVLLANCKMRPAKEKKNQKCAYLKHVRDRLKTSVWMVGEPSRSRNCNEFKQKINKES